MIDIDFFDAVGRFRPTKVLFSPREDPSRASTRWARLFSPFMALHGKIWAKSYLKTHFFGRKESEAMLSTIRDTGSVRKSDFMKTVAECTLRYETLSQARKGKASPPVVFSPAHLENISEVLFDHIASIDWANVDKGFFPQVTYATADNLCSFINALQPDPANDVFVDRIAAFQTRYELWVNQNADNLDNGASKPGAFLIFDGQARLGDTINSAIRSYREQREFNTSPFATPVGTSPSVSHTTDGETEPLIGAKVRLVSDLRNRAQAAAQRAMFDFTIFASFKRCNLIDYLERGESAISGYTDFNELEKLLAAPDDFYKKQLDFLDEEQAKIFMNELQKLKGRLPDIKADCERREAEEAVVPEEGLFEQEAIDTVILQQFKPALFTDWRRLSEEDARKITGWVETLTVQNLNSDSERVFADLMKMSRNFSKWLSEQEAGQADEHDHLRRAARSIAAACSNFQKARAASKKESNQTAVKKIAEKWDKDAVLRSLEEAHAVINRYQDSSKHPKKD